MLTLGQLDEFLRSGGVVLLPNHHGAQHWQDELGRWRRQQSNNAVVAAPAIHAVDLWLRQLWQLLGLHCTDAVLGSRVLSPSEEDLLWQQLLGDSPQGAALLNTTGTARQLREALRLLQLWELSPSDVRRHLQLPFDTEAADDRVLAWRWLQEFQQQCTQQQMLSAGAQLAALLKVLKNNAALARSLLAPKLLWLGFDDPPPLYRALQQVLTTLGVALEYASINGNLPTLSVQRWADTAAECRAVACWAENILATTPTARIGLICPNLQTLRPQLLRIMEQHVAAGELYCSATSTLAGHGFFNTALQLLSISDEKADSLQLCQLLRSRWLVGSAAEMDARAALEMRLRNQGELFTQTALLREMAAQPERGWHSPLLAKALLQLQIQSHRQRKQQTLQQWMEQFQQHWQLLLDLPQLAQQRTLQQAWQQWLDTVHTASALFGRLSRERALSLLASLAQNCHLPNGRSNASVRILTPVEAAGLSFSHLWVMQLHVDAWPGELHPNPCLPLQLQREQQMPAVDAASELQRARSQLQQWQQSTSESVVFSYPSQVDELPVAPSPLLPAVAAAGAEVTIPAALHRQFSRFPHKQLVLTTEPLHLLPPDTLLKGPGSLLAAQASCPFRAFALHRLRAKELPAFSYGLPASAIGELLHKILQEFWLALRESAALADSTATANKLATAIANALRNLASKYPHTVTPRFRQLEEQRLQILLQRWLELEQQRRPFTVEMTEADLKWQHQRLELSMRLDRVDHTANGLVVIDYKTGKLPTADWQALRPQQPQLLLYQQALLAHQQQAISGLLYARISLDTLDYAGVTAADEGDADWIFSADRYITATSWQELQQHWQQVLQALAQEYLDGLVSVAPQFSKSCEYCHLPSLCRINEVRKQQDVAA